MNPADHNPFIEEQDAIKFLEGSAKPKLTREFWESLRLHISYPVDLNIENRNRFLKVIDKMLEE